MTDANPDTNERAIAAFAHALETYAQNPAEPDTKTPPVAIIGPMFRTRGRPQQQADSIRANNRNIGKAFIHVLETELDCTIVPNSELETLRTEAQR